MWRMPYILLRWYALQARREMAGRDLRALDMAVLSLTEDPGDVYSEMRLNLEYAYHVGMPRPEQFLTPGEFRAKVEGAVTGLFDG